MAQQRINGIELYYELTGDGDDTVVLVHGSRTPVTVPGTQRRLSHF